MDQEHHFVPTKEQKKTSVGLAVLMSLVGISDIAAGFWLSLSFYHSPFNLGKLIGMSEGIGVIGIGLLCFVMCSPLKKLWPFSLLKKGTKQDS